MFSTSQLIVLTYYSADALLAPTTIEKLVLQLKHSRGLVRSPYMARLRRHTTSRESLYHSCGCTNISSESAHGSGVLTKAADFCPCNCLLLSFSFLPSFDVVDSLVFLLSYEGSVICSWMGNEGRNVVVRYLSFSILVEVGSSDSNTNVAIFKFSSSGRGDSIS